MRTTHRGTEVTEKLVGRTRRIRRAISAQLATELTRAFSEAPLRDELARVVREAVTDAIRSIDFGNGRPGVGFSRK